MLYFVVPNFPSRAPCGGLQITRAVTDRRHSTSNVNTHTGILLAPLLERMQTERWWIWCKLGVRYIWSVFFQFVHTKMADRMFPKSVEISFTSTSGSEREREVPSTKLGRPLKHTASATNCGSEDALVSYSHVQVKETRRETRTSEKPVGFRPSCSQSTCHLI